MNEPPVSHGSRPIAVLSIAGWGVDASTLRITKDGKATKLEPRAMDVLTYLASRPGRTVSREELEREVWQGQVVVYEALSNAIAKLRKAFEDDPHEPRIIETIPKVGYRLIAEVSGSPAESAISVSAEALSRRLTSPVRWFLGAGAVVAVVASIGITAVWPGFSQWRDESTVSYPQPAATTHDDRPSIAVLPFINTSGDPEQEYFVDGITDDLITDLSKLSGLFVIARNSTFTYKGKAVKVRQVAEELGVRYVLEGSVRRADDKIRINAQLVDATTGGPVWAERYDSSLNDIFALQDKTTRSIVTALAVHLTAGEQEWEEPRETDSPEAYDALLQGVAHYHRGSSEDFAIAISYLEKAIQLDPNFARAHAYLAAVYFHIKNEGWATSFELLDDEAWKKAEHHLKEGMKVPTPFGHVVASRMLLSKGDYEKSIEEAERAIALNPNDSIGYEAVGKVLNKSGRYAEALAYLEKAIRLNPIPGHPYRLGETLYHLERYEESVESFLKSCEIWPGDSWCHLYAAAGYGQLGREQKAQVELETFEKMRAKRGKKPYTLARLEKWEFKVEADRERVQEGLRKAGMPAGVSPPIKFAASVSESPIRVEGTTTIDVDTAKALHDRGVLFVDVRDHADWKLGRISGAVLLELYRDFSESNLSEVVAKDKEVVIHAHGSAGGAPLSARASAQALSWGFKKVYYFRGGFPSWKAAGYPIEVPPE